jgi:hypothetical protein
LNFKVEICLLVAAITLFALSTLFFSTIGTTVALTFVGLGTCLTAAATISYSKRSKRQSANPIF